MLNIIQTFEYNRHYTVIFFLFPDGSGSFCAGENFSFEFSSDQKHTTPMQHSPYRLDHGDSFVDELGGQEIIIKISTAFYTRVYADPDEWFRGMFKSPIENAIKDQYEFFIQRFGGPPLYSQRKGTEIRSSDRWQNSKVIVHYNLLMLYLNLITLLVVCKNEVTALELFSETILNKNN